MKPSLNNTMLNDISRVITEHMGLYFPRAKWKSLEQALCTAAGELGHKDVSECIAWFMSSRPSKERIEALAGYLTIGETYFLREKRCFEILEQQIIPELLRSKQGHEHRLRIWSAGCSTGEEPYTIAIMLHRIRDLLKGYDLSILATDINPHALCKAREGIYSEWSFRTAPPWFKEHYFRQTGGKQYELIPEIRKMVTFSYCNLAEDLYPSLFSGTNALDLIFCRNVLMYFTPELAKKVVERFNLCLLERGWLIVSPCEVSNIFLSAFASVPFPDATLYRKQESRETEERKRGVDEKNFFPFSLPQFPASGSVPDSPVSPGIGSRSSHDSPFSVSTVQTGESCYQKAQSLYERGAYREASEMLTMYLTQDTKDAQALALLCRIYANQGRLSEALQMSDQAIASDRLSPGLHYLRASILQELGMDDESAASLKKAIYLDQDLVLAHFTLGNLEQRRGRVKESQRHFNNALSVLDSYRPDDVIPESDGMSAGRLKEIIRGTTARM